MKIHQTVIEEVEVSPEELASHVDAMTSREYAAFLNALGFQHYLESCPKHYIARVAEKLDEHGVALLKHLMEALSNDGRA